MEENRKKRVGFVVGNYHTDHPSRLVHTIWELLRDEDVELRVFLGTESASFMKDFTMRSNLFDYQYASLCGYSVYERTDLLIISAGTLCIYQNDIPLDEFLRHTPDIPMILMETDRVQGGGISLIADNTQGLAGCVEHLITVHGKTRIGYVSGPDNNKDAEERFEGYRRTLEKYGIPLREEYIAHGDYSEHVDEIVEELLDRAPELEAIVSANDEMAISIYRVCRRRGLTVGKDIAVTGFDDILMARYMEPPLTTARQDYDAFSRAAAESAMKLLNGRKAKSMRIPVPFIKRCSCGCAPDPSDKKEQVISGGQAEWIRDLQRSKEYQHNSWIGSLMNREMLLEVDKPKQFFASIGSFLAYLETSRSYLCLFEHPIEVKQGTILDFPEKICVCMKQEGRGYEGYDWDEAPMMYRNSDDEGFFMPGSFMTFLLFDEEYQYGVLNAAIEPEKIDFYYMLSLDIGTSLRYMDLWAKQKRYRDELQAMARTDSLTGLNNRAGVINVCEDMIGRRTRRGGVIMADLDHLKQINDTFGHHEGDAALMAVADIFLEATGTGARAEAAGAAAGGEAGTAGVGAGKRADAAGSGTDGETGAKARGTGKQAEEVIDRVVGRIGGDEFICCQVNASEDRLREQVKRIDELCEKFNETSGKPYYVEVSAGIATGRVRSISDWTALSGKADEMLYEEKKLRRDFVTRQV